MAVTEFPNRESEVSLYLNNVAIKIPDYQVTLNYTLAEIEAVQQDAANYAYLLTLSNQLKQAVDVYYEFKRQMFEGAEGPMPDIPGFPGISMPGAGMAGIVTRAKLFKRNTMTRPGYTVLIGEALGMEKPVTPPPDPMLITPVLSATPIPDGKIQFKCSKMGMDAVRVEYKLPNVEGWHPGGDFTTAKTVTSLPETLKVNPEKVLYRARLLKKNEPIGQYSSVITVITNP